MRRCEALLAAAALLALALSSAPSASARDEAPSALTPASARPLEPGGEEAALPPGHPMVAPGGDGDDEDENEAPTNAPHPAAPGMFQPPPDTSEEDPRVPPGTIAVEVRDADDKPVPSLMLSLTTLHQSVAKGQSKDSRPLQADENGRARVDHLEIGSSVSYWVKYATQGGTFASIPVQLNPARGVHVVMHVYPVVHDIESALVVAQGAIYFEVKDDRVQVEEAITFFNFGKTAWVPENLVVKLPPTFTALTSQSMMSDQGVESVDKVGARIRGTFAPGRHDLGFRWQLPYDGERELTVDVNVPPHAAIWRVMAAAGKETTLDVTGFPEAQKRSDKQGQRILVTEKQVQRNAALTSVHVMLRGLMVPGPARIVATGLAGFGVALGLVFGVGKRVRGKGAVKSERAELLAEVEELERAHLRGEVGPRAYLRVRRELVDALAETLEVAS
jgi:hypothetical protein